MRLPRTDVELALWFNSFSTSFATRAAALGFTEADVDAVRADAAMVNFIVGELMPVYKSALQARASFKNSVLLGTADGSAAVLPPPPVSGPAPAAVPPGVIPRLRNLIRRIQLAPGYNEAVGLELGIVGAEGGASAPATTPKPTLKARANGPGVVQVDFTKENFNGVVIESRRVGEDGWHTFGVYSYSPYTDDRPPLEVGKPEQREYRARYIRRDQATGEWSDIVTATFVP